MMDRELKHPISLPELGLAEATYKASIWLVPKGEKVYQGERLLEVLAGEVTFDIVAPVSGVLTEKLVCEEDRLSTGQVVGTVTGISV